MILKFLSSYVIPLLFVVFILWRFFRYRRVKSEIPAMLRSGGVIIDVRSRGEYAAGGNLKSTNIPLDELSTSLGQFTPDQPIVVCCASGARSGMALSLLKKRGFKSAVNAGPWRNTVV